MTDDEIRKRMLPDWKVSRSPTGRWYIMERMSPGTWVARGDPHPTEAAALDFWAAVTGS